MLDGGYHEVPHIVGGDAACGGEEAHGFPITAIERKRNPHPLAIVAADLEAVGASAYATGCPTVPPLLSSNLGDPIGSGGSQERGIVGETPNLATRLQGIAEPNMVVIAESTRKLLEPISKIA
jgi:hypothetical protein